jgi:phosphonate transport system substrate-binding protein
MERVCAALQRPCRWVPAPSYEALVERLGRGEVDVAYLGAVTFARAAARHGAMPLAMRDVDFRFSSVIVVRKDAPWRDLDGLQRRRFTFANRSSTSGHIMLRQRLGAENVVPERWFASVQYASDHDAAMRQVADGEVDAAGVNATVFYRRLAAGDRAAAALRVVWQTPPFVDYVWAARNELPEPLRRRLVDAFLDLDLSLTGDRAALQAEGANGFVPAYRDVFDEATSVLRAQGQL